MVARDCLPNVEVVGSIATPGGPTASRSHGAARSYVPPVAAVVEAIIVVPLPAHADLYALLHCSEDFEYGCKTYGDYIEVFWALLVEGSESSPSASENFQSANA
jgi:hypothetical protein